MIGDTGASCSCINKKTFDRIQLSKPLKLQKTNTRIHSFGKSSSKPLGKISVVFEGNNKLFADTVYIMPNDSYENILSKDSCLALGFIKIFHEVKHVYQNDSAKESNSTIKNKDSINKLLEKHSNIFEGDGLLKDYKHHLHVDKSITPVAQRLRRYPHSLREKINYELNELIEKDFIEPVNQPSEWVSNLVVTPKKDGSVRLCLDARAPNKAIARQTYPIPTLESIIDDLKGAKYFSKIDLRNAYCQLMLDEQSRELTTFITEKGMYRYKRMIYGLTSASEDFQRIIEHCFSDLPGVKNISDDTIIYSKTIDEHIERLELLFERASNLGLKFNLEKCSFLQDNIAFFGVIIGKEGVSMDPSKVDAIKTAPPPKHASELKSFLGLATFCSRFVPDFSTKTSVLRDLLKKNTPFIWQDKHDKAFSELKEAISQNVLLSYFDLTKPCTIVSDASDHGLGAVLLQEQQGILKPIAFASRSLSIQERKYATTERECLSLVFAVTKFHNYIFGKRFTAIVDHKPLESLISNANKRASARIERWNLTLQNYDFNILHKPGSENIADCLSRMMIDKESSIANESDEHIRFVTTNAIPDSITIEQVKEASRDDDIISQLIKAIQTGNWKSPKLKDFKNMKDELSIIDNIVLKGNQIVLPKALRERAIKISHLGHLVIQKCKAFIRERVYWPSMNKDIEQIIGSCFTCQAVLPTKTKPEPLQPSPLPTAPWSEISIDFHGPVPSGEKLFVVVDEYSRYPMVYIMKSTTAENTIKRLESAFAIFGIPDSVKSDNGPPFDSRSFGNYLNSKGIFHRRISPEYPQANAKCERFMRVIGKTLQTAKLEKKPWKEELDNLLMTYRNTRHSTTGFSPSLLFFNRDLKTGLPQFTKPIPYDFHVKARANDADKQQKMKGIFDKRTKSQFSDIQVGDIVLLKQRQCNQLSSRYKPEKFIVIEKKGSIVTVKSQVNGSTYSRNVTGMKKLKLSSEDKTNGSHTNEIANTDKIPSTANPTVLRKVYPKRLRK